MIAAKHSMACGGDRYDAEVAWVDTNGGYIITPATLKNIDDITVRFDGALTSWSGDQVVGSYRDVEDIVARRGFRLIANAGSPLYYLDNGYRRIHTSHPYRWYINVNIKLEMHSSNTPFCLLNGVSRDLVLEPLGEYITENTPISICAYLDGSGERASIKARNIEILQEGIPILSLVAVRKEEEGFFYDAVSKTILATADGIRMLYGPDL